VNPHSAESMAGWWGIVTIVVTAALVWSLWPEIVNEARQIVAWWRERSIR
jgi:hypothetical protein